MNNEEKKLKSTQKILDDLEKLFVDNKNIKVKRSENQITFSQDFIDNILIGDNINEKVFNKNKKNFAHIVTIINDNEYTLVDELLDCSGGGGLTGLKLNVNVYRGKINEKGFQLGIGKDNTNDNTGIVLNEWNTESIKEPVREYMKTTGLTEKLPFWTLKRIALFFAIIYSIAIIIAIIIAILGKMK